MGAVCHQVLVVNINRVRSRWGKESLPGSGFFLDESNLAADLVWIDPRAPFPNTRSRLSHPVAADGPNVTEVRKDLRQKLARIAFGSLQTPEAIHQPCEIRVLNLRAEDSIGAGAFFEHSAKMPGHRLNGPPGRERCPRSRIEILLWPAGDSRVPERLAQRAATRPRGSTDQKASLRPPPTQRHARAGSRNDGRTAVPTSGSRASRVSRARGSAVGRRSPAQLYDQAAPATPESTNAEPPGRLPTRCPHSLSKLRVADQPAQRAGNPLLRVAQEPGLTVHNHFGQAAFRFADDREAGGHHLENGERADLFVGLRQMQANVAATQKARHSAGGERAKKLDGFAGTVPRYVRRNLESSRTGARDEQPCVEDIEVWQVGQQAPWEFPRVQPREHRDPHWIPMPRSARPKALEVDAIRNSVHALAFDVRLQLIMERRTRHVGVVSRRHGQREVSHCDPGDRTVPDRCWKERITAPVMDHTGGLERRQHVEHVGVRHRAHLSPSAVQFCAQALAGVCARIAAQHEMLPAGERLNDIDHDPAGASVEMADDAHDRMTIERRSPAAWSSIGQALCQAKPRDGVAVA